MLRKISTGAVVVMAVLLVLSGTALADNVLNNVVAGGNDTITAGGSTTIAYHISATGAGSDGQGGCNASDTSAATITINKPAAVTATPSSLIFSACGTGNAKSVTFSSSTPGTYSITASVQDAGVGSYTVNQAAWTFKVNPGADTTSPQISCDSAPAAWQSGNVTIQCAASDSGSGLANSADASFSLSTSVAADAETSSASTGSRTVFDKAGNSATAGPITGIRVDRKSPAVNCGSADGDWHAANETVSCTASDGGSGLASGSPASFSLSTGVADGVETSNASTDSRTILDSVGNSTTAGPVSGHRVDRKDPVVSCDAAGTSWTASNASIACTASDDGSGLANSDDASFNLTTDVADETENSNASTGSRSVSDNVGNSSTAGPFTGLQVDRRKPTVTCDAAPTAWQGTNVTIQCASSDLGSGLANADDGSFTLTTDVAEGAETDSASTGSRTVYDAAGNSRTVGPITGLKVDRKGPELSCGSADGLWHASDVSIGCSASDGGSGLASGSPASFNLSTNVAGDTETDNASTGSRLLSDAVGNSATAGPISGNKIDKKSPEASCGSASTDWLAVDASIGCAASDGGSGLGSGSPPSFNLTTSVAADTETNNASTGSRLISDAVGNSATAGPIAGNKVDKKSPQHSCDSADGLWHATDVSIGCTASDGGSGLASGSPASFNLSTTVASGTETNNASTGSRLISDAVGNSSTAGPVTGNKVDKKGPTVTCVPSAFILNQSPADVSGTVTDGGSGPASTTASSAGDTSSVGSKSVAVNAADNVGNSGTASCSYTVGFRFVGFSSPVDNDGVLNRAKAGQAIPLKWRLLDAHGNPVTSLSGISASVSVATLNCASGAETDTVELYAAGSSGLQNLGDGYYQWNWKSPTTFANSCRILRLNLGEAWPRTANFQFTR